MFDIVVCSFLRVNGIYGLRRVMIYILWLQDATTLPTGNINHSPFGA